MTSAPSIDGFNWDYAPAPERTRPDIASNYGLFIDGEWCDAEGGRTVPDINPATEAPWAMVAAASAADADRAVRSSERAFPGWRDTSRADRADILGIDAVLLCIRPQKSDRRFAILNLRGKG